MEGKKGRKNRFWSDVEKRSICARACVHRFWIHYLVAAISAA
ncbi:hypothetical protein RUA4292_04032 [Ruegeria atlantica]|uniref:Uncharacterized protein n=1 Tax=Ruegeria atlantica TaxID=81569 RepID=A0A0P1EI89_9RHOB|nr:hypothetical protein RUA4292_04032 [Ruegeria atlantica]